MDTCDIEDDDGTGSVPEVAGDERLETFLACSVPEEDADGSFLDLNSFCKEVDSDSGLMDSYSPELLVSCRRKRCTCSVQ